MLVAALVLDATLGFLFMLAPNSSGPMFSEPGVSLTSLIVPVGVGLNLIGLAWMVRVVRADPEAHSSSWRSVRRR
jgi:hypothetical protein